MIKGNILTLTTAQGGGTNYAARQNFDQRLDSIAIFNTGSVTVNVIFQESTIQPMPIAASTSFSLQPLDLRNETILRVDFTATAASTINMIWIEGPPITIIISTRGK